MDSAAHVLFVEDDPEIRALVADFLRQSSFRMTVAQDGEEMDRVMRTDGVDMLVLDIMLPKEDGLSLCRRVRASGNLPVIMLTDSGSEIDRVVGLEIGADDYLTKPFSSHELVAPHSGAVAALAVRTARAAQRAAVRADVRRLAARSGRATLRSRDGTRVPLTSGEFELLVAFCEHANRVLTRDQLLDYTRQHSGCGRSQHRYPGEPAAAENRKGSKGPGADPDRPLGRVRVRRGGRAGMNFRLRRLLPADLRGQVAGILFLGLALSQLMAAVLYVELLPKWQRVLRPDVAVARIEMVVRLMESVEPDQRPRFDRLWSEENFELSYDRAAEAPQNRSASEPRYAELRDQLATRLGKSRANVQVASDSATKLPDSTRILVALAGGGALEVDTAVGLEHRLGLVAQAGLGASLVFATVGLGCGSP